MCCEVGIINGLATASWATDSLQQAEQRTRYNKLDNWMDAWNCPERQTMDERRGNCQAQWNPHSAETRSCSRQAL